MPRNRIRLLILALATLGILDVAYVPRGEVAVRESFGGSATPLGSGLHLRVPILHRLYRYDTRPIAIDEGVDIVTKDNAGFKLPVTARAWASAGDVLTFHTSRAGRRPDDFIKDQLRGAVRDAAKTLDADQILMADPSRSLVPVVSAALIARGIAVDDLALGRPAPQVVYNAVLDYLQRKFPASARRLAETSLGANPRVSLYHSAMGAVLESEGKKAEAETEFLQALFLDPASPEPMSRLYLIYQASNDPQSLLRLERLLRASLQKQNNSPIHHDWLGQVYMRMHRSAEAEMAFNTAIGQAPKEPEFRVSLGSLKAQEGKLEEARGAYEEALKLKPEHPLALFNLGTLYAVQGQIDKALEYFHRAERAGPPNHALFNSLAQAYELQGKLDLAVEYLRRSLRIRPDQPDRLAELHKDEQRLNKKKV